MYVGRSLSSYRLLLACSTFWMSANIPDRIDLNKEYSSNKFKI